MDFQKEGMSENGGAAAAVSALTAKAKLAGMWREKVDQHNTGSPIVRGVTDLDGCSSPAPPDIAGGSAAKS
jgi:hypothetical protein